MGCRFWLTVVLCCVFVGASTSPGLAASAAVEMGKLLALNSATLEREMKLVIQLPEGYEGSTARYPVMVMMGSDFRAHFARTAADMGFMAAIGEIPPMILVGVDLPEGNGVLIPLREGQARSDVPDRYLEFVRTELLPFVDSSYRTNGHRVLYGASNSGLFVVYALLTQPRAFNAYLASSPMLGWCSDLLAEEATELFTQKELPKRFLYLVYSDDDYAHVRDGVPEFSKILAGAAAGWLEWKVERRINEGHVPVLDVALGLKALFPDFNPTEALSTLDAMKKHYAMLSTRYGFEIPVPGGMLFDLGVDRFRDQNFEAAKALFNYAVELYPDQSRGYVGLAIVARDSGDRTGARRWLEKALELAPDDTLATRILEALPTEE